jgi:GH18 family chitinase
MFLRRFLLSLILLITISIAHTQTCRQVIGYIPNWQWYDRSKLVNPMTIQYQKYSILNYSFFKPETNGSISTTDAWADENLLLGTINWSTTPVSYLPNTSIPSRAHAAGTKVLASIGGWTLSDNFPSIATSATKRALFAHSCVTLCHQYNFDGIDIDWEYPGYADHMGTSADKVNFTIFLQQIRDSLTVYGANQGKTMKLTACVGASAVPMNNVEWSNIVQILDYINLMSYDFFGSWDNITNHNSPLFAPVQGDPTFNISVAVNTLLTTYNVPPAKLNAGVAFYGRSVKTVGTPGLHVPQTHTADNQTFAEDDGSPAYYNILAKANLFTDNWDAQAKSPYLTGNNGLQTFVAYDNPASITERANFINSKNLAGAIIWEITGDYIAGPNNTIASTPLVDALNAGFCGTTPPPTPTVCNLPSSLVATPLATTCSLTWLNTGANSYEIQYKTATATTWTTVTCTTNSYNLTGLLACTPYTWKIKGVCSATLVSGYSTVANFTTSGCCAVPSDLFNLPSATSLALSWTSTGASSYLVQWKLQSATVWNTLAQNPLTNSVTLNNLSNCTTYHWRVASVCAGANSAYTATRTIQTTGCVGCFPPSIYSSIPAQTSANLTWSNMGAASYTVRYRKNGVTAWTTVSSNPTTNSVQINNLLPCTIYKWSIQANCGATSSTFGTNQTLTTTCPPPPTVCNVPTNLFATPANNSILLSWSSTGATNYSVEWKLTSGATWTIITPNITSNSLTINNLVVCMDYQFRVKSVCSTNLSSAFSTIKDCKTTGCTNIGGGTVNCAAPTTFYFNANNYIPIGEIQIGQGRLYPVWGTSVDHFVPQNRLNWAIANVHAAHLFRNVVGTNKIPANFYFATSGKESFNGCDAGIIAAPINTAYPYSYQAASLGDGCFQIENGSAYSEMVTMYPQRFPAGQHANLIGGAHYETAALSKAYYDIFAVKWWEVSKGWNPIGFFNSASDPNAAIKLMAVAYNRGLWYHALDTVLYHNRAAALTASTISPYFTSNYYGYDYQKALSNYCTVLNNQTSQLDPALTATNPATGQPYNYFTNYYDAQVTWAQMSGYIDAIAPMYPTVNLATVKTAVQTTFNSINGGNAVSFRYQLGAVLDKLLLSLPADDPSANIATNYGCAGIVTPPPPAICNTPIDFSVVPQLNAATLNWSSVTGAISYNIQWKLVSATVWNNATSASNTLTINNLLSCSDYQFKVASVCSTTSASVYAIPIKFTTICSPTPLVCDAPNGLSVVPQSTSATLSWAAISGAVSYNVQWKAANATIWIPATTTFNSLTINNLTSCTGYQVKVASVCSSTSSSTYSTVLNFSTIGCGTPPPALLNYCSAYSLVSIEEWIQFFKMGAYTNASGNNYGFGNFIDQGPTLLAGSTVQVRFKPGFSGAAKNEYWRLWVDWNRDGDFTDANELCFTTNSTTADTLTQLITVPVPVSYGYTRMRLSMKRGVAMDICEVFSQGEVEDFAPILTNTPFIPVFSADRNAETDVADFKEKMDIHLYPNPGFDDLNIRFHVDQIAKFAIKIIDFQGKIVISREIGSLNAGVFEEKITELYNFASGGFTVVLLENGKIISSKRWIKL